MTALSWAANRGWKEVCQVLIPHFQMQGGDMNHGTKVSLKHVMFVSVAFSRKAYLTVKPYHEKTGL